MNLGRDALAGDYQFVSAVAAVSSGLSLRPQAQRRGEGTKINAVPTESGPHFHEMEADFDMVEVYLVQHVHSEHEAEDTKIIGVFSSKTNAETAIAKAKKFARLS